MTSPEPFQPQPAGHGHPPPRPRHGKAIAGLVFGIIALLLCWTSIFDSLFVLLGMIFSILGITDARHGAGGRGIALWGLWCTIVAALGVIVLTFVYVVLLVSSDRSCGSRYAVGTSQYETCATS